MEADTVIPVKADRRRRRLRSRNRQKRLIRKVPVSLGPDSCSNKPIDVNDCALYIEKGPFTNTQAFVLLHSPANPLQIRSGLFLHREKLFFGYQVSNQLESAAIEHPESQASSHLVIPLKHKSILEDFVDFDTLEIKHDAISTVFSVTFESAAKGVTLEIPQDGSEIDTSNCFEAYVIVHMTKATINRSQLCSELVELKRKDDDRILGKRRHPGEGFVWKWPRLQKAKPDYTFLGSDPQNSTVFLAKLNPEEDYTFDEENWELGSPLYSESTSLKMGTKSVQTYSLRTLQGMISVIFDSPEVQLRFTKFVHTVISGTSEDRMIGLWAYKLKTFCGSCMDTAIWINQDFEFKGSYFSRPSFKTGLLDRDLRSSTILKLTTAPKFVSKPISSRHSKSSGSDKEGCLHETTCATPDLTNSGIDSKDDDSCLEDHHSPKQSSPDGETVYNNTAANDYAAYALSNEPEQINRTQNTVRVTHITGPWAEQAARPFATPGAFMGTSVLQLNPMMGSQQFQAIQSITNGRKPLRLPPPEPFQPLPPIPVYRMPICHEQYPKSQHYSSY